VVLGVDISKQKFDAHLSVGNKERPDNKELDLRGS
jgi:hypothetical protein